MSETTNSKAPAQDLRGTSVHERSRARRLGCGPAASARPSRRSRMAFGSKLGSTRSRRGGTPHQGALAARRLRRRIARRDCEQLFKELKNPYYLGDEVGLTQSLGWIGAWTSEPSVYAVAAKTTQDVVAAVNFARTNNLRLVVKGGGHSYQGTSNAANSLLDLDAPHERDHTARRLRRRRLRGSRGAATRRVDRAGRNLGTCL